ncbi:MAG: aspartate carbamoyltransferase regulatory subunit [Candidatus Magasanikbacteria bacterium]|nr:aspartate carbamoyltransferase regulatory subunit [Candidatus Magasanikbacteria bacterium]
MKDCIAIELMTIEEFYRVIIGSLRMVPYYFRRQKPPYDVGEGVWLPPKAGYIFDEPSSRTIGSFQEAAERLGFRHGFPVTPESSSLQKGESLVKAMVTCLQQGCDLVFFRTKMEGATLHAAQSLQRMDPELVWHRTNVPIINGGDGTKNHPSQVLLDCVCIVLRRLDIRRCNEVELDRLEEFLRQPEEEIRAFIKNVFDNLQIAFIGDLKFSRVVSSWLALGQKFRIKYILVAPPVFQVDGWRLNRVEAATTANLRDALKADINYVMRTQQERLKGVMTEAEATATLEELEIGPDYMREFRGEIMHAQPLDAKFPMVLAPVWYHERCLIDMQAAMGPPTRMALILECWNDRDAKGPLLEVAAVSPTVSGEMTIEEHRQQRDDKLAGQGTRRRSVDDIDRGMVFDHLPVDSGILIQSVLWQSGILPDGCPGLIVANEQESPKLKEKDIIWLRDRFLPYEVLAALTLIAPNMTVVELKGGMYRKLSFGLPRAVSDLFRCPNPACITIKDPSAGSFFEVDGSTSAENAHLHCAFCGGRFTRRQIINNLR